MKIIKKKETNKQENLSSLAKVNSHINYIKHISKTLITIFFGTVFTLIFFEISLFAFSQLKKQIHNAQNDFSKQNEFVILALGESTTTPVLNLKMQDYSWPAYLEQLLNEENLNKKIKVINMGKESVNSHIILDDLEKNIEKYDPDLVISMMGINDFFGEIAYETAAGIEVDSLLYKSRAYKLIKFLIANIKNKRELENKGKLDCNSEESCIYLASIQGDKNFFENQLAIKLLKKALNYNPNNIDAVVDLGYRYMSSYAESKNQKVQNEITIIQAIKYFKQAIEHNPANPFAQAGLIESLEQSTDLKNEVILLNTEKIKENIQKYKIENTQLFLALAACAKCHREETVSLYKNENRIYYLNKALENDPLSPNVSLELARYYAQYGDFKKTESFYLKVLETDIRNEIYTTALIELANFYLKTDKQAFADEVFKQAIDIGGLYVRNYQELFEILKAKGIRLMAVGYPIRSIASLKLIFKNNKDVLLVDNEMSFKNLVKEEGYNAIFLDRFAGDFGHCTEKGNLLLAENIKSVILENWDKISSKN